MKKDKARMMFSIARSVVIHVERRYDRSIPWFEGYSDMQLIMQKYAVVLIGGLGLTKEEAIEREIGVFKKVDETIAERTYITDDPHRFKLFLTVLEEDMKQMFAEHMENGKLMIEVKDLLPVTTRNVLRRLRGNGVTAMQYSH